ncbi:NADPH-dependent FMN reductase [Rhodosalinus sp.]|uniref:NADPH-dependent FMN reductase n=1 Tax=Rhodosalinus sp. TaxID=2047741 RepID=UPI00397860D6
MADLTLLGMSGSLRAGSFNRKLLAEAVRRFAPATYLEGDLRLPLYDGDLEEREGLPESVRRLTEAVALADAVVIASPEYNKGVTGVMKNALDWISRAEGFPLGDKPTAVISANAGRTGGETGQYMLRACLVPLRPAVLEYPMVMVAGAGDHFDAGDRLVTESYATSLDTLMARLRDAAER